MGISNRKFDKISGFVGADARKYATDPGRLYLVRADFGNVRTFRTKSDYRPKGIIRKPIHAGIT
jgi:hypothetical protein